jgi:hypothetical protein
MRCIINNGASFIFDKIDLTLIKKHTWSIARGHIRTVINGKTRYLHRLLLGAPSTVEIDHINQNKLDNRRCNLRLASHFQNQQNRGRRIDNTSGFKGVCYLKKQNCFVAYINAFGKREYLGYYKKAVDAGRAYDKAALRVHKEYACLNAN